MRKLEGASLRTYTIRVGVKVQTIWTQFKRSILIISSLSLMLSTLSFLGQTAQAAQITSRSLTISSAVPSQTGVTYTFSFKPGTASVINGFTIQLCTAAVGTCSGVSGANIQTVSTPTFTGFAGTISGGAQTTSGTLNSVDCSQNYDYCYTFSDGSSQLTSGALSITFAGVTNPGPTPGTFYGRLTTYNSSTISSGTAVDSGNVAAATTSSFQVNATVQEQLTFCVGSANGNSATVEQVAYPLNTCGSLGTSSLNLGTLTGSAISVSPMATAQPYNGDLNNGVAELTTNAANGSTITYNSVSMGTGANHPGSMKVAGAACASGTSYVDQCINSIGSTAGQLTLGTENFGMAVTGVNCYNVPSVVYTCSSTAHALAINSNYNCNSTAATTSFTGIDAGGQITGTPGTTKTACNYAWDDTEASNTVATSSGVVGDEGLILEFAAAPELTTPTGAYVAEANFVATPTY